MSVKRAIIVGGGAAGYFAAISCGEALARETVPGKDFEILVLEGTTHLLAKVKVSGGGRCNVTHACFEPKQLVARYPRGHRELLGPLHKWGPTQTVQWFHSHGVELKTESDGRMFPATDLSQTIVDCLDRAAKVAGVTIRTGAPVDSIERETEDGKDIFRVQLVNGETIAAHCVTVATGGNRSSTAYSIAEKFGHHIEPLVPSLFTFHIKDPRIEGLQGVSVENVVTSIAETKLKEAGPLLVTHWGMSGPAILKLSAWGARILYDKKYNFTLRVNWCPDLSPTAVLARLQEARSANPKKQLSTFCPFGFSQRLWDRLVVATGLPPLNTWTGVSNDKLAILAGQLTASEFQVTGKSTFKEEFVTCGGVRLSEIDFKTMESRLQPHLHFAGEVLDIDGVTGGFNFQSAWTTGYLAGNAMAATLRDS